MRCASFVHFSKFQFYFELTCNFFKTFPYENFFESVYFDLREVWALQFLGVGIAILVMVWYILHNFLHVI
jgi:hypothetical protein